MYLFGKTSLARLAGVHPDLVRVVNRAIQISAQDFGVAEGVRSAADQLRDWQRHASKLNGIPLGETRDGVVGTGVGQHQVKADGFGHAVDLVPYVDGVILWSCGLTDDEQWAHIYPVAEAMRSVAIAEGVRMRWGGVWDMALSDLPEGAAALKGAELAYRQRRGGHAFVDGPHFELI